MMIINTPYTTFFSFMFYPLAIDNERDDRLIRNFCLPAPANETNVIVRAFIYLFITEIFGVIIQNYVLNVE